MIESFYNFHRVQAQDRCHRIGQTREVHIYRLISEHTIEENILRKSDQKRHLDFLAIQSGGFTTDILYGASQPETGTKMLSSSDAAASEEMRAAMRAAEDEGDAQAALAAEKETAAEMEEFTRDAPSASAGGISEDEKYKEDVETSEGVHDATAAKPSDEEEDISEVAKLVVVEKEGDDPIAALDRALRPIERYAVRFIEAYAQSVDREALTAQMEATYKVDQFDIVAMEVAEEQRVRGAWCRSVQFCKLMMSCFCRRPKLMRTKKQMLWLTGTK